MYELDSLYAYNGHNTNHNPDNIRNYSDTESDNIIEESEKTSTKKPIKNWLILGGVIIITLIVSKNHQVFISKITNSPINEGEKTEVSASPTPDNLAPSLDTLSGDEYYQSLLPSLIEKQRVELKMQNNRFIWLMKNNLVRDAQNAKGTSAEEYLTVRLRNIIYSWQEKIADKNYDFSSAIGLEEGLLLVPRIEALLLAYEEVTGQEIELSTYKNGDKVPPNLASIVAGLKQIHQVAETIRLNQPEAQLRQEVLERRIEELEKKLNQPQPEIKESPAP